MIQEETLKKIIKGLQKLKTPYMLVGALAVNYYGKIRLTHDIDIVIEINSFKKGLFVKEFQDEFYVSSEAISEAIRRKSSYNLIHNKSGLKIDFWLVKRDEYSQFRFKRRRETRIYNLRVNIISPEDLIITKLAWWQKSGSEKHFEDALGVYQIQKGSLDEEYIKRWVVKQGIFELWQKIKRWAK